MNEDDVNFGVQIRGYLGILAGKLMVPPDFGASTKPEPNTLDCYHNFHGNSGLCA